MNRNDTSWPQDRRAFIDRARALRLRCRTALRQRPVLYALWRTVKYGFYRGFVHGGAHRRLMDQARRENWRLLYLGCGGRRQPGMINVDITAETDPDVVADGYQLPFADGTFDAIICESVVEHVPDPEAFIAAATATLKPGGYWYFEVPLLQPFHGGVDFQRWTIDGFRRALLRAGLEPMDADVHLGPGFFAMWFLAEWSALAFSFGIAPLRAKLTWLFRFVFSPLLLTDLWLSRLPGADTLACSTCHIARRPTPTPATPTPATLMTLSPMTTTP